MAQRLQNDHLFGGPRLLRQQPVEGANDLGADQIILPTSDPNSSTTVVVTLVADVLPGDTCIFCVGTRTGTPTGVVSATGIPADCTVEILKFDNGGSPTASLVRIFSPTGMAAGLAITLNFANPPGKKGVFGWRYHNLANRPTIGWNVCVFNATKNGITLPTQEIPQALLPATHVGVFAWGGATIPQILIGGGDEEGTMPFLGGLTVGASSPAVVGAQLRPALTGPHSSLTMTMTNQTLGSIFVAVHAVWSTVADLEYVAQPRPLRAGLARRGGPPVVAQQEGVDIAAAAAETTRLIAPVVVGQAVNSAAVI